MSSRGSFYASTTRRLLWLSVGWLGSIPWLVADEPIPWKEGGPSVASTLPQVMLWLGILMAVAFIVIMVARKRLVKRGLVPETRGNNIRVLDRCSVSARTTVHVLQIDEERWLLCESPSGAQLVRASGEPPNRSDAEIL